MTTRRLVIGCGKAKLHRPAAARDLYTGSLFQSARRYAETVSPGRPWFVLSAWYGLVPHHDIIEPYEMRLDMVSEESLDDWHATVREQVTVWRLTSELWEVHAPRFYVVEFCHALRLAGVGPVEPGPRVIDPLDGLGIGKRMQWYAERRHAAK